VGAPAEVVVDVFGHGMRGVEAGARRVQIGALFDHPALIVHQADAAAEQGAQVTGAQGGRVGQVGDGEETVIEIVDQDAVSHIGAIAAGREAGAARTHAAVAVGAAHAIFE